MIPATISAILSEGRAYFLIYGILAGAMILENLFENEKFSRALARLGAVLLILFIGLRWETGSDWLPYYKVFYTNDTSADFDSVVFGIDEGYVFFNRIMYALSESYTTFLLVDAAIAIGLVYFFIKRSTNKPNMAMFLFYTSYAITHFMGSNRRMIAIGLVCVAFLRLKEERQFRRWTGWVVPFGFASVFHRTSLMALPGMVVSRRAFPAVPVIVGLLACAGIGIAGIPSAGLEALGSFLSNYAHVTVVNKLLFYTSGGEAQASSDFNVMAQAALGLAKRVIILAILLPYMKWGTPTLYASRLYNIYVIGCAIYFLMIGSPVFQVTSTYYTIVEIVLIPIVLSDLRQLKVLYSLYLLAVCLMLTVSALVPLMIYYVPYRSVFTW